MLAIRGGGRLRGLLLKVRIWAVGGQVGAGLSAGRGVRLMLGTGAQVRIGDNLHLGHGVLITVGSEGSLAIGDDVLIGPYAIIVARHEITFADRAMIGEHSSTRDHEHDPSAASLRTGAFRGSPIRVGHDCWVGKGVAVLKGADIGPGAIIGANAVVRGEVPENAIAAGVPARVIRLRDTG